MSFDELRRDLDEHIELETRENIERGMTPAAARAAALRKFGNVTIRSLTAAARSE